MDEPIFFLCEKISNRTKMYWYVLEDGRNMIKDEIKEGTSDEGCVEPLLVSEYNSDVLRSFCIPYLHPKIRNTNLVIINSCIYTLGGHDDLIFDKENPSTTLPTDRIAMFCGTLDLHNYKPNWQLVSSFPSYQSFMNMATSDNGSIVVIGSNSYHKKRLLWLPSLTSRWELLPKPPKKLFYFSTVQLLALTDTHIFCTVCSKTDGSRYGLRFNLVYKEWDVFDTSSFNGIWSKGVVLYDLYLVLYGRISTKPDDKACLCVYDLVECRWVLKKSHVGNMYKNAFPSNSNCFQILPNMFKVAHNKLAVVWNNMVYDHGFPRFPFSSPEPHFELYCTKFVLHKILRSSPPLTRGAKKRKITPPSPLSFNFRVFSHGTYRVYGRVINCGVRVPSR